MDNRLSLSLIQGLGTPEGSLDELLDSFIIYELVLEPYFIHLAAERISAALSLFKN
jgi:hypothetical protein